MLSSNTDQAATRTPEIRIAEQGRIPVLARSSPTPPVHSAKPLPAAQALPALVPILSLERAPVADSFLNVSNIDNSAVSDALRNLRILTAHLGEKNFKEVVALDGKRKFELEREGRTGSLIHVSVYDWKPLVQRFTESLDLTFRNGRPQGGVDHHAPFKRGRNELGVEPWSGVLSGLEEILSKAGYMATELPAEVAVASRGEPQGLEAASLGSNFVSRSIRKSQRARARKQFTAY